MICLLQSVVRAGLVVRTRPCWRPTPPQTTLTSACPTSSPLASLMLEFSVIFLLFLTHNKTNFTGVCFSGVAYISTICKNYAYTLLRKDGKLTAGYLSPNTGFVTFAGNSQPRELSSIVTFAHEVGHNLGAQHDGTNNKCNPRKYMMASQTSTLQKTFSHCSKNYFKAEMQRLEEVKSGSGGSSRGFSEKFFRSPPENVL